MRRLKLLFIFIAIVTFQIGAYNPQEIISFKSKIYDSMDKLYLVAGYGIPSNARPWSKSEALIILNRIDPSLLTNHQRELYKEIKDEISTNNLLYNSDVFGISIGADLNTEMYWHSNSAKFIVEDDWVYGFVKRKPLLRLRFDISLSDFAYIYSDLQYNRNIFNYKDEKITKTAVGAIVDGRTGSGYYVTKSAIYSKEFFTNIMPFNESYDVDFETPKRAILSVGGNHWKFTFGRDKVAWGNGKSGNFIIDNHVDFHEFGRLKFFSDKFSYDWLNVFLPTRTYHGEDPDERLRFLMAHRLEFRPWKRLTVAFSENVMFYNEVFDIKYLNPAFIYHNLNNRSMFNAIAHVELDFMILKGLNIYGQFVLDQARAPNEPATQADATGYLGGVEYVKEVGPGFLSTSLEFVLTSPILYRRDEVDFLMFRPYFTHGNPSGPGYVLKFDYIGYKYGSDTLLLQWDLEYSMLSNLNFGLTVIGMRQGEVDLFYDNENITSYQGSTPSGTEIKESLIISLTGSYDKPKLFGSRFDLSVWSEFDWIGKRTFIKNTQMHEDNRSDFQITVGMGLSF